MFLISFQLIHTVRISFSAVWLACISSFLSALNRINSVLFIKLELLSSNLMSKISFMMTKLIFNWLWKYNWVVWCNAKRKSCCSFYYKTSAEVCSGPHLSWRGSHVINHMTTGQELATSGLLRPRSWSSGVMSCWRSASKNRAASWPAISSAVV